MAAQTPKSAGGAALPASVCNSRKTAETKKSSGGDESHTRRSKNIIFSIVEQAEKVKQPYGWETGHMPVRETARDRQTQACGCGSIPHTGAMGASPQTSLFLSYSTSFYNLFCKSRAQVASGDTPGKAAMRTKIREGQAGSIPALGTMSPIRRRERIEVGIHTSFHNKPFAAAGGRCDR